MSLQRICVLFHFFYNAYAAVLIVGSRDLGMVANTSVPLTLNLTPASLAPVELTVNVSAGFTAGVSAASATLSSVVLRWERGQSRQLLYVRSSQCSPSGTLSFSPTTSTNASYVGIVAAPSSVNLYCAFPGSIEVFLAGGVSPSDLVLRDGQSVNVIFRAIRRRATTSTAGGVIPLNLPPGIQSNQNGSVLFPRFRSDQLSTEIQVTLTPDSTAARVSEITFGPVLSDDPEWRGVVPLPSLTLRTVRTGSITATPSSLACMVGSRTTFFLALSAPSENEIRVGVTLPVGMSLATGLSVIVLPPGSVGPFFVDVICATATAGGIVFSAADTLDLAFAETQITPPQLTIYSTLPARIELRDNTGVPLTSPSLRLLTQGSTSFRVVLLPATSRFIGNGGGTIGITVSPGFVVSPSPIRFGALVAPSEIVVFVNSTSLSTLPGNLTFTPVASADPQWQNLLPSPFSVISLFPVRQASFTLQAPAQVLVGQLSNVVLIPSAPAVSAVRVTVAVSNGFKLNSPLPQDSVVVELPANFTGALNISLSALSQTTGIVAVTRIETDDVQYRAALLPNVNVTSFAAGNLVFRFVDGSPLPPVLSILIGQTYLFTLLVDRGNGVLNSTLPNGEIPFTKPPTFNLVRDGQVLNSVIPFEPLPSGVASRSTTLTLTATSVLQGNITFGAISSSSIVWSGLTPRPAVIIVDAVQPAIIAVSVSTLALLTSSSGSVTLRTSVLPRANVSFVLSVPVGFRVQANSAIAVISSNSSIGAVVVNDANTSSTSAASALFFPASDVIVSFPAGVNTLTLTIQADSTVHPFSLLLLSPVVSTDVRFNGILPSVNAITLSSTERGRLIVMLSWDNRQPLLVVAGSVVTVMLAFIGNPNAGGTLIAVCPGFTFLEGGSLGASSSVISFVGNSTANITLLAPNVTGLVVSLTLLNITSRDAEWNGVQADIPAIPLRVVEAPSVVILNTSLSLRVNQPTTLLVRVRPPPSAPVSIPVSVPAGCTFSGGTDGTIVIPTNQQGPFAVNFSCSSISSGIPQIISLGSVQSADQLLNGAVVMPVNNISLVVYSPGTITVLNRNNVSLANENQNVISDLRAFPIGIVVFNLVFQRTFNNSAAVAPTAAVNSSTRNNFTATAPQGCLFLPSPEMVLSSDFSVAEVSFDLPPSAASSSLQLLLNCSVAAGARAGGNFVLSFSEVRSASLEWNRVNVSPPFVNFTLFALTPITLSTDSLSVRFPNPSIFTLSVPFAPSSGVLIPFSISGQYAVRDNNGNNVTVISFPRSQTRVNVSVYALIGGEGSGVLTFGSPRSDDSRFATTRIRPVNVINLLNVEEAKVSILDPYRRAGDSEISNVILVRNARNITLNFTWSQVTNATTSFDILIDNTNFTVSPSSFSFPSGSDRFLSLPVVLTSPSFAVNSSLLLRVSETTDAQWDRFSLRIPVVSVPTASFNVSASTNVVAVGNSVSFTIQSSLVPSSDVSIRVLLPPFLTLLFGTDISTLNQTVIRLPASRTNTSFTAMAMYPSPCEPLFSEVNFGVSSQDESFANVFIYPILLQVYDYGSVRVANANGGFVDTIVWRRNQVESLNYSVLFYDSCNRTLGERLPSPFPPLFLTSSSPQLQAQINEQCTAQTFPSSCRAILSVYSVVTWWNDSRTLFLSLNISRPINNSASTRVLASLPITANFQGGGIITVVWLSPPPYYVNESILVRFVFTPPPARPVALNFETLSNLQILSSNTQNISAGQGQANLRFTSLSPGDFTWPFTVSSNDTIYTSIDPFSFTVLPALIPVTAFPTLFPTTLTPSRKPTRRPTTLTPSVAPTLLPTFSPTLFPTTNIPTPFPPSLPIIPLTPLPTLLPTQNPSTLSPTLRPSLRPTTKPTFSPSLSPTFRPTTRTPTRTPTLKPSFLRRTPLPTASPTLTPTLSPSTLAPTAAVITVAPSEQVADIPRRAQISLNVTTDAQGNINGASPTQFLTQLSSDLNAGLEALGVSLAPGQLTAVSLTNQTAGRRLLAAESVLVDLNVLPASAPGQSSSQEVYKSIGTALRSRDGRLLEYSPLTRAINPDFYPAAVPLLNCSGGELAVVCASTPSTRGIAVAPTGFDPNAVSTIGSLLWWEVIVIAAAIVLFLILCCIIICCCCKKKRPAPAKQAPLVPGPKPKPVVTIPADGSHGIQLTAVPVPTKRAVSTRAVVEEKKAEIPKPLRPIVVIKASDSLKWRCSKCTYDNDSGSVCSICGAPKSARVATLTHLAPMPGSEEKKKMPKKKPRQSIEGTPSKVELKEIAVEPVPENVFGAVDQVEWAAKPELVNSAAVWDAPEQKQLPDEEGFEEVPEDTELVVDRPPPELPSWERLVTYAPRTSDASAEHVTLIAPSLMRNDVGTSSSMAVDEAAVDRIGAALGGEEGADEGDEEEDETEDPVARAARRQARQERRLERRAKKAARKDEKRKRREATLHATEGTTVVGGDGVVIITPSRASSEIISEEKSERSSIAEDDRGSGVLDDEARLARKAERKEKKRAKKDSRREKRSKRAAVGEEEDVEGEIESIDHAVEPGAASNVIVPIPEGAEGEEHPEG